MSVVRAAVILHTVDTVPENFVTNAWAFELDAPFTSTAAVTAALKAFYDSLVGWYSPAIAQNGHEIKYYMLPAVEPNYPYDTDFWNLGAAPAGSAFPDEVAVCLSFQGGRQAGFPQARRRGRVYLGPFDATINAGNRPVAGFLTAAANAATTMSTAINAISAASEWVVWSEADQQGVTIVDGWLDNAFDTQRRRGVQANSRTTFLA